jgi:hypothetical protein
LEERAASKDEDGGRLTQPPLQSCASASVALSLIAIKKTGFNPKINYILTMLTTISISEAKRRLGEIADRALEGSPIVIVRKHKLLVLSRFEMPDPVPMRPPGYFDDCYDKAATLESNRLAAHSTRKIVK